MPTITITEELMIELRQASANRELPVEDIAEDILRYAMGFTKDKRLPDFRASLHREEGDSVSEGAVNNKESDDSNDSSLLALAGKYSSGDPKSDDEDDYSHDPLLELSGAFDLGESDLSERVDEVLWQEVDSEHGFSFKRRDP